jgi:hypothetical protein
MVPCTYLMLLLVGALLESVGCTPVAVAVPAVACCAAVMYDGCVCRPQHEFTHYQPR